MLKYRGKVTMTLGDRINQSLTLDTWAAIGIIEDATARVKKWGRVYDSGNKVTPAILTRLDHMRIRLIVSD